MSAEIRVGKVSSIDYPSGMIRVTYPDMDDDVTRLIPLFSSEYAMPPVGALVAVVHLSNGAEAGVVLGRPWSAKLTPPEGFEGLYRKDFDLTPGQCYFRYDAAGPESLFHNEGDSAVEIKGDCTERIEGSQDTRIKGDRTAAIDGSADTTVKGDCSKTVQGSQTTAIRGDATITVSGKLTLQVGGCTVQIDGSRVSVTAASEVSLSGPTLKLEGTTVQISGATVNITGGAGDCAITGKSLVNHTHTCAAPGSPTTPPL
ncbi:hypothetical protein [Faecalibacterium sp. An122]|uniref:bacteriophage T4 gp5 trimerisation domain-containing protein n=1 Tax=Faecalibacterium sp. An122 TaxID=1965551 RepID=UPI000B3A7AA4|nr:hypothetical protein [Faecalibacterium sp. An122]OUQ35632.1 hypothetical protein B5E67_11590 [Faecalibacterium sp. An122]